LLPFTKKEGPCREGESLRNQKKKRRKKGERLSGKDHTIGRTRLGWQRGEAPDCAGKKSAPGGKGAGARTIWKENSWLKRVSLELIKVPDRGKKKNGALPYDPIERG